MRFDDSLDTVLAAEMSSPAAIQWTWRQLVDLIGRRRSRVRPEAIQRLRAIRDDVPAAARVAAARGLERANPPAALAALFVDDDDVTIAGPVVRSAQLTADEWIALLPTMKPATRGIMRLRRDLSERVVGALAAFGPTDFALGSGQAAADTADRWPPLAVEPQPAEPAPDIATAERLSEAWPPVQEPAPANEPVTDVPAAVWPPAPEQPVAEPAEPVADQWPPVPAPEPVHDVAPEPDVHTWPPATAPEFVPPEPDPFIAVADAARELPLVAEARRLDERAVAPAGPSRKDFEIAALVARIEAHQRTASDQPRVPLEASVAAPDRFRFESDARGLIRWVEGIAREPLIGLSLTDGGDGAPATVDGGAAGAMMRRARFADARLEVGGVSVAAGSWRITGTPVFDRASGRFTGYRGVARRPRADEAPQPAASAAVDSGPAADVLRQLVHELRTPANAISGFAEMIEQEMLGPVPPAYREQAAAIRGQSAGLLDAIDDLDTAARLESHRLDLHPEAVELTPLLARTLNGLNQLANLRGAVLSLGVSPGVVASGDMRAIDRLLSRFLTALVASAEAGETIEGLVARDGDAVTLTVGRPRAFAAPEGTLFAADAEVEAGTPGGPLLGTGFGFRLARRLSHELGGSLVVERDRLTLRLPAAVDQAVEQATV